MSLAPLDLVSAHPWRKAAFTTYALSLSFFEAVLLDALVRGGGREALILADVQGVRTALGEKGARRVGRDYEVEPVAVANGVFHPKISVLAAEDECHVLVGSGNLTFGGWGGNFEVLEHLHPSFAADAIEDTAVFFERLAIANHLTHCAADHCNAIAGDLRASVRAQPRSGDIRLLHSLDGAIMETLAQAIEDLGGAERLVVAAPFWDHASAIDQLCRLIGVDRVFVHAHAGGSVEGTAGSNWPHSADVEVYPIQLDVMTEERPRRLHAKVFEVVCRRGRVLLSGSANATQAALDSNRNVEACVMRIQREQTEGWTFSESERPDQLSMLESELDQNDDACGVLRAVLEGDQLHGQILTPGINGAVSVFQLGTEGPELLGKTNVDADRIFYLTAPDLEVYSWKGGRLVLRVEGANGRVAEGFVSVAAFTEMTRRAGAVGSRLMAVLAGTETPADVAAIMSWIHEDPRRLEGAMPIAGSGGPGGSDTRQESNATVAVGELNSAHAIPLASRSNRASGGSANWMRFMGHVFAALRERRGPFGRTRTGRRGEDDDEGEREDPAAPPEDDPYVERSLEVFKRLLEKLLSKEIAPRYAITAFDLTQYVCERLQPDVQIATLWLRRLIDAMVHAKPSVDRREDVAAAILTLLGMRSGRDGDRTARAQLLRLGFDMAGGPPSSQGVQGFQTILIQTAEFSDLWTRLRSVRTYPEQVRSLLSDLKAGQPLRDYSDLASQAPDEWPILERAFESGRLRNRILVMDRWSESCPRCHIRLPSGQISRLRSSAIASAKNCCGRILIWPGD